MKQLCALLLMVVGCLSVAGATYPSNTSYRVYCGGLTIPAGTEQEVTLYMTNPASIKRAFQVDVVLPANLEPVSLGSSVGYCQSLTGADIVSAYVTSTRTLRLVVTHSSVVQAQSGAAFAKIKLRAGNNFGAGGTMNINNFIFALSSNGVGYYGSNVSVPVTGNVPATGISLSSSTASVLIGSTLQLTATVSPSNATNKTVTWRSSNTSIATVNSSGKVTGVNLGTATITATTADGTNLSASCQVTVNPVLATSVSLNKSSETLLAGESVQLTATVLPSNTTDKSVTWKSSNTAVATVDANGRVTAVKPGTATITVTTADGSNRTATCKVTVQPVLVSLLSLNLTETSMRPNDKVQLTASVQPSNATNKTVAWTTSDAGVATVNDNGLVTANAPGTATITARTTDGSNLTATCKVTVQRPLATSLTFDNEEMTLYVGETHTVAATVLPAEALQALNWTSSKPAVATVDANGQLKAVGEGTTVIVATTADGSNLTATCIVTVKPRPATGIQLDRTEVTLAKGENVTLHATVLPDNATNRNVTWKSSNTKIATVDANGKVTAVAAGTARITATTADGTNLSVSCQVTVVEAWVSQIVLDKTQMELLLHHTDTLHATVLPENAAIKAVTWTSSNEQVVSVDEEGVVYAAATGTATITATATDGSGKQATCVITVPTAQGNYLSAEPVTIVRGSEAIVPIAMTNGELISAFQTELRLTGGLQVAEDEYGDFDIYLEPVRNGGDHELVCTQRQDFMQVRASSISATPFRSNMGTLFYIHLKADKSLEEGTYMLALRNIQLSTTDGRRIQPQDVEVTIGLQPYLKGDANGDSYVDVADYLTTANYINYLEPFPFFFRAADVDADGFVNVSDLVGIVNIGLGKTQQNAPRPRNAETEMPALQATHVQPLTLALNGDMPLTALQLDLRLPEGVTVTDAQLSTRSADDHQVSLGTAPDGTTRVLVSSPSNAAIDGTSGDLVTLALEGDLSAESVIEVTAAKAVEPNGITYDLDDLHLVMNTTGIAGLTAYDEVRIYADGKSIVIESPEAGTAQLVQVNGLVAPLNVKAGRNVYEAPQYGIYVVRMGGKAVKVVI